MKGSISMDLSCAFAPGPDTPSHAALAEKLGYQRVWLYDSPALYHDVWVALSRVADVTDRIGLGTAVLVPSLRHVLVTASAIATLEHSHPGRLAVAIGTGFTGSRMLGQKPIPWKRVDRYIRDLRELLAGGQVEVDGGVVQMAHPGGCAPARPIDVPIVVAANGPKGLAVARERGDGVMCVGVPQAGFEWCSLLTMGTVLDDGETASSPEVFERIGPGIAVVYHGSYESSPAAVDALPGGAGWRKEIEAIPESVRHLAVHEDHLVRLSERDRRHVSPALAGATFTGHATELRARLPELEAAGLSELLYAPMGPDIPRELHAMSDALTA
jgi:5,10-methylenetetrahydromethanopterin reductase